MQITKIAIKRPTLVVVIFTVLAVVGAFCYSLLSYELLPKFTIPVMTITTTYPGAAPTEVENSVTKKVEDAVSSLEGIESIKSTSMESASIIVIQLKQGTDEDLAIEQAQRKVNAILADLPDDADPPALGKFDFGELPIMRIGAHSNLSPTAFYDLLQDRIKPDLGRLNGVAAVTLLGGREREVQVNVDKDKLDAYGISILQVQQAITTGNLDFPTGKIKNNNGQILIRLSGKFTNVDQITNLPIVNRPDGSTVKMSDVAKVVDTEKDIEVLNRINGKEAVGLSIQKQADANAVQVSAEVKKELKDLEKTYAKEGLNFEISTDSSDFTLEAANGVIFDLGFAVLLVAAVMLLFLHSFRNAIIVMISVPLSIIATFIMMYLAGFTLNLMTLLALSLVVGILVDDAIVVIENIYRHLEMGKSAAQASYDGIREISSTVMSITLVIVVVFVPLALTGGLISGILKQFSITVATATLMSLFVAFTVIPLLTSRFSKLEHLNTKSLFGRFLASFERGLDSFVEGMVNALKWSFRHKTIVLVGTFLLFIGAMSLVGAGFIGSEFISQGDQAEFIVQVKLPKDATVEQTNQKILQIEKVLRKQPEITTLNTIVGTTSDMFGGGQNSAYKGEVDVKMVPQEQRNISSADFAHKMQILLRQEIVNADIKSVPVSITGGANQAPIQIVLEGASLDTLTQYGDKIMAAMRKVPGTAAIETSVEAGNPEIRVVVNREKMADLGLSVNTVGASLQTAFNGYDKSKLRDLKQDKDYDINIRLNAFDRRSVNDIENLVLINNVGQKIKLKQFADVQQSEGPTQLERWNRVRSITLQSQVVGRPQGTVGNEVKAAIAKIRKPNGVNIDYEGNMKSQGDAFSSLGVALLASILFVYLIMVALYDNYVYPFVVMFSLPLAMIGALLALALTLQSLSIFSILGIIMLIGLVAKNAILLVDFANTSKNQGMEVKEALVHAVRMRFRPILMTTLAMVFGMLPIAIAKGAGAEWKNGLAWALIGGLISSMFLTLVIVPVVYYIFDRILARFGLDKRKVIELNDDPLKISEETAGVI